LFFGEIELDEETVENIMAAVKEASEEEEGEQIPLAEYVGITETLGVSEHAYPIHLHEGVEEESAKEVITRIYGAITVRNRILHYKELYPEDPILAQVDAIPEITIMVSTYGGDAYECMALCDAIEKAKNEGITVHTIGTGKVMSAGIAIVASGSEGCRKATKNTGFMIHDVGGYAAGLITQMENDIEESKAVRERYFGVIIENSDITHTQVQNWIEERLNKYLTAKEARLYGIIDQID
jgi:ATP-dependent protease ClpP protease subunit